MVGIKAWNDSLFQREQCRLILARVATAGQIAQYQAIVLGLIKNCSELGQDVLLLCFRKIQEILDFYKLEDRLGVRNHNTVEGV